MLRACLFLLCVSAVAGSNTTDGYMATLVSYAADAGPVVFGAINAAVSVVPVPGAASSFALAAGVMYGKVYGTLLYSFSAAVGAAVHFQLVKLARPLAMSLMSSYKAKIIALDSAVSADGLQVAFLLRLSPVMPFAITTTLLGLTKIAPTVHFLASFGGLVPSSFVYAYAGEVGNTLAQGPQHSSTLDYITYAVGLLATVAVTAKVMRVASKALNDKQSSA
eukprot:Sspe_Gene.26230::Locus_10771_Transcript_1_2_Confidence_0.667_Length_909::g.26230::m.26230